MISRPRKDGGRKQMSFIWLGSARAAAMWLPGWPGVSIMSPPVHKTDQAALPYRPPDYPHQASFQERVARIIIAYSFLFLSYSLGSQRCFTFSWDWETSSILWKTRIWKVPSRRKSEIRFLEIIPNFHPGLTGNLLLCLSFQQDETFLQLLRPSLLPAKLLPSQGPFLILRVGVDRPGSKS